MKIAISGCGGFIGNYAVRHFLRNGYKVRGMDNFYKGHCDALFEVITNPNFEFFNGSVTNKKDCAKLVENVDAVINLAAIVGFPQCSKNEELAWATNYNGTINMLEARNKISTKIPFILTSTGSVYGAVTDLCTEETGCNTNTVYGLTKLEAEKVTLKYPNVVVFRYATAFGVSPCMRVQLLVNDFVHRATTERIINVFEADFKRTFIHISDFVNSLDFAINNIDKMNEKIYNCGDNKLNWTKRQLAEYVSKKTGCHIHFAETGKDLDVRNYEVSYDRLNKLGFYCKKSMEEGIDELIKAAPLLKVGNRYEPN